MNNTTTLRGQPVGGQPRCARTWEGKKRKQKEKTNCKRRLGSNCHRVAYFSIAARFAIDFALRMPACMPALTPLLVGRARAMASDSAWLPACEMLS